MNNPHYEKEIDQLALGLTRSPMFMGVNVRFFFANLMFCALLCLNAHTFWGIPLFILIHLSMVRLSIKEPNSLYIQCKALLMTPPILNRRYWGNTTSYEPW